jgi:hypothetical protein
VGQRVENKRERRDKMRHRNLMFEKKQGEVGEGRRVLEKKVR